MRSTPHPEDKPDPDIITLTLRVRLNSQQRRALAQLHELETETGMASVRYCRNVFEALTDRYLEKLRREG